MRPISPKLLALLAIDAPPGDRGMSGISGERLSSVDLLDDASLKSCADRCGRAFLVLLDVSEPVEDLIGVRVAGGCSATGVAALDCLCIRLRWEAWEDCEVVEPWDWRRASGKRPSLMRLHGWK